jgi:transcriptional regulator with XRE-family HTH domain
MSRKKKAILATGDDSDGELRSMIGGKIKRIRKRRDKTARFVAEKSGITRGGLTQIENGRNNVNAVLLWKIANALNCDVKDFFPAVPDVKSFTEADAKIIELENKKAAEFARKAFKPK